MGPKTQSTTSSARAEPLAGSRWLLRAVLAIGGPLAFLIALEGVLRVSGYGYPDDLFIADGRPGLYRTNPHFTAPYFPPQFDITPLNFRIARRKEPGHFRIFVLGESAARGTPVPGFGFASQLLAQLRAAYPGRAFEVYNLGIVAINSHVVYQMARQAAEFEPDLFVVYMGNNEVVGPYGPGSANLSAMPPLSVIRASIWSNGTRTGQLVASLLRRLAKPAADPVDWRGMATFTGKTVRGDDPRLGAVYRNYEANLRDIVGVASGKGIKIILATVVANLRDCPPFASLHAEGTGASQLDAWSRSYGAGIRQWELGMPDKAISSLNEALKIDPQYAESHYVLGRLLDDRGEKPGARAHYLQALHWDALRFRPDAPINAIARRVASESPGSVLLVDSALEMGSDEASAGPPSGQEVLLEHVHFNWDGNVRLARMLAEKAATLLEAGGPRAPWLDSTGCAAAIGYTGFGRLTMLRLMGPIWGKPPFTNQVGFGEDQARRAHDLSLAAEEATSPEGLARARGQIEAALVRDPDNASLSLSLSEVDAESNQPGPSLLQIDRVLDLEPTSPELLVRRARLLAALGRLGEAQAAVLDSIRLDPYHLPSYTALVEVLRKTGDFGAGRTTFAGALAGNPDSGYVRLAYADLLFFHGDRDLAVGECQTVLARDPGNADALGRLASLYTGEGRTQEAFDLMARARKTQPFNFENNLALARIYQERGNEDNVADCLTAATQSGPADVSAYLFLAHHFKKLNRQDDALLELARANRVATLNGNLELAKRISAEIESSSNDN